MTFVILYIYIIKITKFMPKKLTLSEFVKKSKEIHGDKYLYDKSVYVNTKTLLTITCKIHGDFLQKPENHFAKCGCQVCDPTNNLGTDKFIEKSKIIHSDIYDYSLVNYIKNDIKVSIICRIHGIFNQIPAAHLKGQRCPKCNNNNVKRTTEEFIQLSKDVHGDLYNYDLVDYKNKRIRVKIKCENHGIFEQLPYVHLNGANCPRCKSSAMEIYLRKKLLKLNINFIQNMRFDNCRNKQTLPFDFYLPEQNVLIECDGIQHHKSIEYFGGEERYQYQKINDSIKSNFCLEQNIKLIRVNNSFDIDHLSY
jgi:very-short-patch-repair endonuclease